MKSLSHVQPLATPRTADYEPPPSRDFKARVLEWGAIAFSKWKSEGIEFKIIWIAGSEE